MGDECRAVEQLDRLAVRQGLAHPSVIDGPEGDLRSGASLDGEASRRLDHANVVSSRKAKDRA